MTTAREGFSTLTSVIVVDGAQATIDAYQSALGAEVCGVLNCPKTGKVAHACLKFGEATLFIHDEFPEMGKVATGKQSFYVYVDNADDAFEKAKGAGWAATSEPEDMFWGDRVGTVQDTIGNTWQLAQNMREVSPEEMQEAMKKMGEAA